MNRKNKLASSGGQIAIIMILVAAVAIILYAVSLNLAKITQTKTVETVAANTAASLMASEMASYAESLYQTQLGGKKGTGEDLSVCGWTGVIGALVAIIAIIIILASYGSATPAAVALMQAALVLAIVYVGLQIAVIQPGLTDLWNRMMGGLAPPDQFVERGIQTALQAVVNDQKQVPDENDIDVDSFFGSEDLVNRFGVYYTERLKRQDLTNNKIIEDFLNELEKFIYGYSKYDEPRFDPQNDARAWSLWDPMCDVYTNHPCCLDPKDRGNVLPAECNPCCLPETVPGGISGLGEPGDDFRVRPSCCDAPGEDYCGTASTCGNGPYGDAYPYVYTQFYEDYTNNCLNMDMGCHGRPAGSGQEWKRHLSFKEVLGRDDEHPEFNMKEGNPVYHFWEPQNVSGGAFRAEDVRSFPIAFEDSRLGQEYLSRGTVFDFLWAMGHLGTDLSKVDPINNGGHCFWCDDRLPDSFTGNPICPEDPDGLKLPLNCEGADYPGGCSGSEVNDWCVDKSTDKVGNLGQGPNGEETVFTKVDKCSTGIGATEGIWKIGGDRFCSDDWPYENSCSKHGFCRDDDFEPRECQCGEAGAAPPAEWPDDVIDDMVYGLNEFIGWSSELLELGREAAVKNFYAWRDSAAEWVFSNPNSEEQGALITWHGLIDTLRLEMTKWLEDDYSRRKKSGDTVTCDQESENYAWCVPPTNCPVNAGIAQKEVEAWKIGVDGKVTLDSVLNCLYYNAYQHDSLPPAEGGNAQKFLDCANKDPNVNGGRVCSEATCKDLPRSLADGYYDKMYEQDPDTGEWKFIFKPGDPDAASAFRACLDNCSAQTCENLPPPIGDRYEEGDNNNPFKECLYGCSESACSSLPEFDYSAHPFTPPGPEFETIRRCVDGFCSPGGLSGDCRSPILFPEFNGIPQDCSPGSEYLNALRQERDAQAGSCAAGSGFLSAVASDPRINEEGEGNSCDDPDFIQDVEQALKDAEGSCGDDEFIKIMEDSHQLALNQVVKFRHRYKYLMQRQKQATKLVDRLADASSHFQQFLEGPAKELKGVSENPGDNEALSNRIIYGWKSDPAPGEEKAYWHLVRVDARSPGRCDGQCGRNGAVEPRFPTIKSYTRHWSTRRCYSLGDSFGQPGCNNKSDYKRESKCFKGGLVKARVVRFDEDKQELTFPNKIAIWKFVFHHPSRAAVTDVSALEACSGMGGPANAPAGAFMLNGPETSLSCWNLANSVLERGVESQTCAEYFYHKPHGSASNRGFGLKFVKCPDVM